MEMEAEEEQDLFASIIKFCKQIEEEEEQEPTASLSNCPLARESDKFLNSNNEQFSSEAKIVKVERKDSQSGAHSGKFELAGKSWISRLHEAKDSHRSGGVRLLLSRKRIEEIDEFRFDDGEWEGRSDSGRQRFLPPSLKERGKEKEKEKVKENEKEKVKEKVKENEKEKAEIIVLDSEYSVSEEVRVTWNSDAAATVSTVREIGGLLSNDLAKSDPINGNHELGGNVEDIDVPRAENSGQIEGDISNIGGVDKAVTTPKDAIDSHGNEGVRSSRVDDELSYVGSVVGGECKGRRRRRVGRSGRKRVLPPSLKGKEKEVGEKMSGLSLEEKEEKKKSGLLDLLDILKSVFGDMDGGCDKEEDVDFLETAKSRGMMFPRPRWWPSDGDEEEGFSS